MGSSISPLFGIERLALKPPISNWKFNVVRNLQPRKKGWPLKHKSTLRIWSHNLHAINKHLASGRRRKPSHHVQNGCFPTPRGANHRNCFPFLNRQRKSIECKPRSKCFRNVLELDFFLRRVRQFYLPTQCNIRRSMNRNSISMVTPTIPIKATPTYTLLMAYT